MRLYPVPGADTDILDANTFYTLPSPSTWYSVDRVTPGDRLVLIAMRPSREEAHPPQMTPAQLADLRRLRETGAFTGASVHMDVPIPTELK